MERSELANHVPESKTWLRAAIAAVPYAGGALDHLLFDKADAIRIRNMEAAIASLSEQLERLGETTIDKEWFGSEEAIAAFKILSEKASYEPDKGKVDALGRIVAACGTVQHSKDDMKLSVVDHLSRLSATQMKLLLAISKTAPQERKYSGGSVEQTATAIWIEDIAGTLKKGPTFWAGNLQLNQQLDVLESYSTVRRAGLPRNIGYTLTALGQHAVSYVESAGL